MIVFVVCWEASKRSACEEIPRLLRNRRFITVFTTAHHLILSRANWMQSTSTHPASRYYF
jgi:hypothetical protein